MVFVTSSLTDCLIFSTVSFIVLVSIALVSTSVNHLNDFMDFGFPKTPLWTTLKSL